MKNPNYLQRKPYLQRLIKEKKKNVLLIHITHFVIKMDL